MSETGDLFAHEDQTSDENGQSMDAPATDAVNLPDTLAKHRVLGPLLRKELNRAQPRPGYITGLANLEKNERIKKALLELRARLSSDSAELSE